MAASELAARALVIDTNIVLDLLVFQDEKMRPLLADIEQGRVRWLATAPMRAELQRVLDYPTVQPRMHWHGLTKVQVLAQFDALSTVVDIADKVAVTCGDADDQKFLDLAAAHRASLISKDKLVLKCRKRLQKWGAQEVSSTYVAQSQAELIEAGA